MRYIYTAGESMKKSGVGSFSLWTYLKATSLKSAMYLYQAFVCALFAFAHVSASGYGIPGNVAPSGVGTSLHGGNAAYYKSGAVSYRGDVISHGVTPSRYIPPLEYVVKGQDYSAGHQIFAPKPYAFDYQAPGVHGNHFHKEQGDGSGSVQGSYGYTDNQGLFRQVDYVADAGGFRASVRTNEPGTDDGKENPADVNLATQPSPQGVQEQYTRPAAYGPVSYGPVNYGTSVSHRSYGTGYVADGHKGVGVGYSEHGGTHKAGIQGGAISGVTYTTHGGPAPGVVAQHPTYKSTVPAVSTRYASFGGPAHVTRTAYSTYNTHGATVPALPAAGPGYVKFGGHVPVVDAPHIATPVGPGYIKHGIHGSVSGKSGY